MTFKNNALLLLIILCLLTNAGIYLFYPSLFTPLFDKAVNYFHYQFNYLLSAAALLALAPTLIALMIDCKILGYNNSAIKRLLKPSASARMDIFLYLCVFTRSMRLLAIACSAGVLYFFPKLFEQYTHINITIQLESPLAQFFLMLVIQDFVEYWRHRLAHRISWWWQLHKVHHSATEFNVITVARSHPLEIAFSSIITYIPLSLIGLDVETFLLIKILYSLQGKLQHSMIHWRWGWVGKYLFISPVDHRIHHSCEKVHWDKNFGHITPLWDRLFGTWYDGDVINDEINVTANHYNKNGIISDLIMGQMDFLKYLLFRRWSFSYGVTKKQ